jgi:DNA polymerase-3 subunit delta'
VRIFESVIGHERVCEVLRRQVETGQVAHAYLFVGPEAVGKTTVALAFIEALAGPLAANPNVSVIERETDAETDKLASSISVVQVRALMERLTLSAFGSGHKAAFIEEADRLNTNAANALLKTLEEPRGDTLIILRAPSLESVPETIASRCQVFRFHPVAAGTIEAALRSRGVPAADAAELTTLARGRPGVALRLLKDAAFRAEHSLARDTAERFIKASLPERFRLIAELLPKEEANKAVAATQTLDALEESLRDRLLLALHNSTIPQLNDSRPFDAIHASRQALRGNVSPALALEHVALNLPPV